MPHEFSEEALSSGGGAPGFLGGEGAAADSDTGKSGERVEEPEDESARPDTLDEAEIDPTVSTVVSVCVFVCGRMFVLFFSIQKVRYGLKM